MGVARSGLWAPALYKVYQGWGLQRRDPMDPPEENGRKFTPTPPIASKLRLGNTRQFCFPFVILLQDAFAPRGNHSSPISSVVWDQAPHWGKEENKIDERSEPRGSLGRGKGGALSPSPIHSRLTLLADIFPICPRFCLFPPLRSMVPGYNFCNFSRLKPSTVPWFELRVTVETQRHGLRLKLLTLGVGESLLLELTSMPLRKKTTGARDHLPPRVRVS